MSKFRKEKFCKIKGKNEDGDRIILKAYLIYEGMYAKAHIWCYVNGDGKPYYDFWDSRYSPNNTPCKALKILKTRIKGMLTRSI